MFLDFLNGEKKIITKSDIFDLVKSYDVSSVYASYMPKNATNQLVNYNIESVSINKYYFTPVEYSCLDKVIFIDDDNKRIYVKKDTLFQQTFHIYFKKESNSNIILNDNIGKYEIIDIVKTLHDVENAISDLRMKTINNKKEDFLKEIDDEKIKDFSSQIETNLYNILIKEENIVLPKMVSIPNTMTEIIKLLELYLFDRNSFEDHISSEIESNLSKDFVYKKIVSYFLTMERLEKDDIPEDIILAQKINTALQNAGKSIKVSCIDGKSEVEIKCESNLVGYDIRKYNSYSYINIKNITKISFGKKVLFEK